MNNIIKPILFILAVIVSLGLSHISVANDEIYTNSIGMKFKTIPAGSFYMGSCKLSFAQRKANKKRQSLGQPVEAASCPSDASTDKNAGDDETPQHLVHITKAFQIGIYEVTVGQFKQFIGRNLTPGGRLEFRFDNNYSSLRYDSFNQANNHGDLAAVSLVSWLLAQVFIEWLNKREGGKHYRLPTEAEWEYAARAGTTTRYSWGNDEDMAGDYAWYGKNAYDRGQKYAHRVGRKKPNPWGLYDMHGNVWEWVQDLYSPNYYANSRLQGLQGDLYRVLRGGAWNSYAKFLRSAGRLNYYQKFENEDIGFRLVRMP